MRDDLNVQVFINGGSPHLTSRPVEAISFPALLCSNKPYLIPKIPLFGLYNPNSFWGTVGLYNLKTSLTRFSINFSNQ